MLFPSVIFIFIFLPISLTVIVPFTVKGRYYNIKLANFLLLIFSLIFYMYGEVKFTYIMLGSGGINFICAKLCAPSQNEYRKYYFFAGITTNVFILVYFKYTAFFYIYYKLIKHFMILV